MNNPERRLQEFRVQYNALMKARSAFLGDLDNHELWTTVSSCVHSTLSAFIIFWDCCRKTYDILEEPDLLLALKFPNNQLKHNEKITFTSSFQHGSTFPMSFPSVFLTPDVYWAPIKKPIKLLHPDQYELYLKKLVRVPVHSSFDFALKEIAKLSPIDASS